VGDEGAESLILHFYFFTQHTFFHFSLIPIIFPFAKSSRPFPLCKRGIKGDLIKEGDLKLGGFLKSPPTPLFPPSVFPLYKRGLKGDLIKEGDLKLGGFLKSPPAPLFPPSVFPLYKRGIKGDLIKEGDLKLGGF